MKPVISLLALVMPVYIFCQQATPSATDYLEKSKKQKKIALITGIPGCALITIGGIMFLSEFGDGLPGGDGYNESRVKTGEALAIAGAVLAAVSVPFAIASRVNRKKAMSLSFKNIFIPQAEKSDIVYIPQASLCLIIRL